MSGKEVWYNVRVRAMYLISGGGGGGGSVIPPPVRVIGDTDDPKYYPNVPTIPSVVCINAPKRAMNRGGQIVDLGTTDLYFQSDLLVPFKNAWRKIVVSDTPKVRDNIHLTDEQRVRAYFCRTIRSID